MLGLGAMVRSHGKGTCNYGFGGVEPWLQNTYLMHPIDRCLSGMVPPLPIKLTSIWGVPLNLFVGTNHTDLQI